MSIEQQTTRGSAPPLQLAPVPSAVVSRSGPAANDLQPTIDGSLVAQLNALYEERAFLHNALGTSDAASIVAMVRSLEAQLMDVYSARRQDFVRTAAPVASGLNDSSKLTSHTEARDNG